MSANEQHELEQRVRELSAEVERLRAEQERATRGRDTLVRDLLAQQGGLSSPPLPRHRPTLSLVAVILLGGLAASLLWTLWTLQLGRREAARARMAPFPLSSPRRPTPLAPPQPLDPPAAHALAILPVTELSLLRAVAFAPARGEVALGGLDGKLVRYALPSGRVLGVLQAHRQRVQALAFSPDGRVLASGGADGTVLVWTLDAGQLGTPRTLRSGGSPIRCLAVSDALVAVAAEQPVVELLSLEGKPPRRLAGHEGWVRAVAFTADGTRLASAGHDQVIRIWATADGRELAQLKGHRLWVTALAFAPQGDLLASAGFDSSVYLWRVKDGELLRRFSGPSRAVSALAFAPRGTHLAASSLDRNVYLWRLASGELTRLEGHRYQVLAVAFGAQGSPVISASSDGTLRLTPFPWPQPRVLAPLPPPRPGELTLRGYTSGERVRVLACDPRARQHVLEEGRRQLAWLLRSSADDAQSLPDPRLIKLLCQVAEHFGRQREIVLISGYRSADYNELRRRQSSQVGRESRHLRGEAIDFYIDGIALTTLHRYVQGLRLGGVGFYPDSHFVHMDVGPVRHWEGN